MGFWFYMLCTTLLIPALMIALGARFRRRAPKKINYFFGFRTRRSMASREAWDFAHHQLGKLWVPVGWATLILSAAVMLRARTWGVGAVSALGTGVTLAQLPALILPALLTERRLRRRFDENGIPR